jgi:hypothetical protein
MANMMPTVTGSNVMASGTAMPSGGGMSMGEGCKISVGLRPSSKRNETVY